MNPRWKQSPPGSNWGEFGPDDQRGRMNYVDRDKVLQGVAEVKEGRTFCLSLPLDLPGGMAVNPKRRPPRRFSVMRGGNSGAQSFLYSYAGEDPRLTDVVCDDVVLMTLQYSTQWDSFAHVGGHFDADADGEAEAVFYNGFRSGRDIHAGREVPEAEPWARFQDPRADALGIQNLAEHGAQGRGVMIDFDAHFGRTRRAVGYDALMRVLETDAVAVEKGDMVCIHTGFGDMLMGMQGAPDAAKLHAAETGLDGHDGKLLNWITDSKLSALVSDNPAVELPQAIKFDRPTPIRAPRLPLHEHCLFKNGIHLGELWYLTALARWLREHGRSRFLLTAPPLRLPGAVGSPATPVATV
jgi:kynurenine formamidase